MASKSKERRNKGEGSITKLDNGKYKVVITLPSVGKQVRKSKTVATKSEAIKALKELQAMYRTKEDAYKELNKVSFEVYSDRYLARKEATIKPRSYTTYYHTLKNHIIPYIGDMNIGDIKATHINNLLLEAKELKPNSRKLIRSLLTGIFNSAVKEELINHSPVANSDKVVNTKRKVDMILPTEEEMNKLLEVLKEEDYVLYVIVLTAIHTGLRRGEIIGLRWSNIDKEKGLLRIRSQRRSLSESTPKTQESIRDVYVNKKLIEILSTVKTKNDFVFNRVEFKVDNLKRKYFTRLGFHKDMTFHDLRHYHATMLLKKEVNVKIISKRLGHKNVNTTLNIYTHYDPEMGLQAVEKIGDTNII